MITYVNGPRTFKRVAGGCASLGTERLRVHEQGAALLDLVISELVWNLDGTARTNARTERRR